MFMKNLLKLIILSAAVVLIAVSCIPYEVLRGEYRDVTFYNNTSGPVDIEYQVIGSTYSAPNRIDKGGFDKMKVYTVDGRATFVAEGPYVSYKWTAETINYDGSSQFTVNSNRGLIQIINNTDIYITDVCLGTVVNPKKYKATFSITKNMDIESADIAPGKDAGIRVMYDDIASSSTTPYYIYFTYNNTRYRTSSSVELPKIGTSITRVLTLEECTIII